MAGSSSASYIHMVQHMIEKCLIFHMSKEECVEALSKHANITPVITSTDLRFQCYGEETFVSDAPIFEYNESAVVAMVGKNCFAIAGDRRIGVQLQTININL
ncbi:hypothetical protein Rs2_22669 [Raphanus sativus]|nr:hypothetical protein Rs2_22669 [Raphanus sativus]